MKTVRTASVPKGKVWYHPLSCEVMLQTLELLPLDFYVCLRIKFHKSSFWVLILAAGGPYFTKKWVLIGSLSQSLGVLISFGDSDCALNDYTL